MSLKIDILPVMAILIVIISMVGVDVFIIADPFRAVSAIPISLFLVIWLISTIKMRRSK